MHAFLNFIILVRGQVGSGGGQSPHPRPHPRHFPVEKRLFDKSVYAVCIFVGFYFTLSSQGYRYDIGWYDTLLGRLFLCRILSAALASMLVFVE